MSYKYKKIYDIFSTLKVLCSLIAVFYIIYWVLDFLKIPYISYISLVFNPLIDLIKNIFQWDIAYNNRTIDMLPLIVAIIFEIFYFVFQFLANYTEKKEERYRLSVIEEKKLEERLVNKDLKEIFKRKTLRYTKFAILLTLNLKPSIDLNLLDENIDLKDLAMKDYVKIVSIMRKKYCTCKAITPNKLFILYDNFILFDDFFTDMVKEMKTICDINSEKNINTDFTFAIEAMNDTDKVSDILDLLEKITTFNYTNKAIATSAFNIRYNLNEQRKYSLDTIGISRFYTNNPDGTQTGSDFELYCLKTKKHYQ